MKSLKELYRIGPGPSSSHTMGPQRACKEMLKRCPQADHFRAGLRTITMLRCMARWP